MTQCQLKWCRGVGCLIREGGRSLPHYAPPNEGYVSCYYLCCFLLSLCVYKGLAPLLTHRPLPLSLCMWHTGKRIMSLIERYIAKEKLKYAKEPLKFWQRHVMKIAWQDDTRIIFVKASRGMGKTFLGNWMRVLAGAFWTDILSVEGLLGLHSGHLLVVLDMPHEASTQWDMGLLLKIKDGLADCTDGHPTGTCDRRVVVFVRDLPKNMMDLPEGRTHIINVTEE